MGLERCLRQPQRDQPSQPTEQRGHEQASQQAGFTGNPTKGLENHPGKQGSDQSSGGIAHIIETNIQRDVLGFCIGQKIPEGPAIHVVGKMSGIFVLNPQMFPGKPDTVLPGVSFPNERRYLSFITARTRTPSW